MIPVGMENVRVEDAFWTRYMDLVRDVMIPYQWEVMNDRVPGVEKSHAIANFRIAAGREEGEFYGYRFQDSDVYKWLEAVAYSLARTPDPALEALADGVIELVGAAQQPDGYLNTHFTIKAPEKRWKNERDSHELYVAGHLFEAAAAYYRATSKRGLLEIAMRNADHIASIFGPEEGKRRGYPGHQVTEMALVSLFEASGEPRYLDLARFFIDERGASPNYFDLEAAGRGEEGDRGRFGSRMYEYTQSHLPVREQRVAVGHAVRAMYMYSAMADLAAIDGDEGLASACRSLWEDVTRRQMYITGGLGQEEFWEGFSRDYDLPNDMTYNETCASVGLVFWARRMARLELRGDYYDVAERALYNGVLSGMSLDGKKYFYVNLLESDPREIAARRDTDYAAPTRQGWFACACCPPNLARLLSSLGGYQYSRDERGIALHLYLAGRAEIETAGTRVALTVEGDYARDGMIRVRVEPEAEARFTLYARVPGWCESLEASICGEACGEPRDGYLAIDRSWRPGDLLELSFGMAVRRMAAHPSVRADAGKVAIVRGPLVYCLEERDNGPELWGISLAREPGFEARFEPELLGGVVAVYGAGSRPAGDWEGRLYAEPSAASAPLRLKAIPYYAWDNRGQNGMAVWIRQDRY